MALEDGTMEDHRNLELTTSPRFLDVVPPKLKSPQKPVFPKSAWAIFYEERRLAKAKKREAFLKAKSSLESTLAGALNKVVDCFAQWDEDGSGTIDKLEFRKACTEQLNWKCKRHTDVDSGKSWGPDEVCDSVFADHDIDDSGKVSYAEYVRYALRRALQKASSRVMDVFKKWDTNGSGMIEKGEFRRAIKEIGFDAPKDEVDSIFAMADTDGSGIVSYAELNTLMRQGANVKLDKELQDGAKGEIVLVAKNKIAIRMDMHERTGSKRAATVDELRKALAESRTRVMDLFKAFDRDNNCRVEKAEFRAALALLNFDTSSNEAIDELFDSLDEDGSGWVDHVELNEKLRQGQEVVLDEALQDGAAGEIVLEAKLKIKARETLAESDARRVLKVVTFDALRQALSDGLTRVVEVFRTLDRNKDGVVQKAEFRAALPMLGFESHDTTVIDSVFDELDTDQSGSIEYDELAARLEMRGKEWDAMRKDFKTDETLALESVRYGSNPLAKGAADGVWAGGMQ